MSMKKQLIELLQFDKDIMEMIRQIANDVGKKADRSGELRTANGTEGAEECLESGAAEADLRLSDLEQQRRMLENQYTEAVEEIKVLRQRNEILQEQCEGMLDHCRIVQEQNERLREDARELERHCER